MSEKPNKDPVNYPWCEHRIPVDEPVGWCVGRLKLWCKATYEEIWVAHQYAGPDDDECEGASDVPEGSTWSRWAIDGPHEKVLLSPALPDRSVVVEPEFPFKLTAGAKARIFVRVPLWVQMTIAGVSNGKLLDLPTAVLSNTWFGSFTSGELCYWTSSRARRQIDPEVFEPSLVICPVEITNLAKEGLHIEKLSLHMEGLSLFIHRGQLWSDETKISYKGLNEVSQIDLSGVAPMEIADAPRITAPRVPLKKGFAATSFRSLKDLPGLGLLIK